MGSVGDHAEVIDLEERVPDAGLLLGRKNIHPDYLSLHEMPRADQVTRSDTDGTSALTDPASFRNSCAGTHFMDVA